MKDYYEILGVSKDASQDDIKKAYRNLAKQYHPDKTKGDKVLEEKFKDVSEAYENIGNEENRKKYDNRNSQPNFSDFFGGFTDVSDFFSFGRDVKKSKPKGGNLRCTINVTLEDVFNGFDKVIKISRLNSCSKCDGTGAKDKNNTIKCPLCEGSGKTSRKISNGFFQRVEWSICPLCNGDKTVPKDICQHCSGEGVIKESNEIKFSVKKGVDEPNFILPNEGNSIKNGVKGDLHIILNFIPHDKFLRRGVNIEYDLHVGVLDAMLGSSVVVPTLHGDVSVKLNESIQNGKLLKLTGKGLPKYDSNLYGDQYMRVIIDIPKELTESEKEILSLLKNNKFLYGIL